MFFFASWRIKLKKKGQWKATDSKANEDTPAAEQTGTCL